MGLEPPHMEQIDSHLGELLTLEPYAARQRRHGGGRERPAPDPPPPSAYFSSTLSALPISQNVGAHRPTKIANR